MCGKLWPIVATILPGDQIRLACVHRQGRAWKVVTLIICHILLLLLKCDHFQRINKMCTGSRSWLLFCAPERWQSHCSVYRAAELEHILCTASWSQVAKCVPIHSLNITTPASYNPQAPVKRDQSAETRWCNVSSVVQGEERDQFQFHYCWPFSDSAPFGILNNDFIAWNNWASQHHCQWELKFSADTLIAGLK